MRFNINETSEAEETADHVTLSRLIFSLKSDPREAADFTAVFTSSLSVSERRRRWKALGRGGCPSSRHTRLVSVAK